MKNVFFDLDGTLTDSGEGIINSIKYALNKLEQPEADLETLRKFIGPPLMDSFQDYTGLSKENAKLGMIYYREYYEVKGLYENKLYDDVKHLLESLKENKRNIYLTTSKPEPYAKQILKHFAIDEYFSDVYGASMDETMSEKTFIIQNALENISPKVNPQETLMVGDRSYDMSGGKDHGLTTVGVLYGFGSEEELKNSGADFIINKPLDLLNYI